MWQTSEWLFLECGGLGSICLLCLWMRGWCNNSCLILEVSFLKYPGVRLLRVVWVAVCPPGGYTQKRTPQQPGPPNSLAVLHSTQHPSSQINITQMMQLTASDAHKVCIQLLEV